MNLKDIYEKINEAQVLIFTEMDKALDSLLDIVDQNNENIKEISQKLLCLDYKNSDVRDKYLELRDEIKVESEYINNKMVEIDRQGSKKVQDTWEWYKNIIDIYTASTRNKREFMLISTRVKEMNNKIKSRERYVKRLINNELTEWNNMNGKNLLSVFKGIILNEEVELQNIFSTCFENSKYTIDDFRRMIEEDNISFEIKEHEIKLEYKTINGYRFNKNLYLVDEEFNDELDNRYVVLIDREAKSKKEDSVSKLIEKVKSKVKKGVFIDKSPEEYNKMAVEKGFEFNRQTGGHRIFSNVEGEIVVIPQHGALGKGLQLKILKDING